MERFLNKRIEQIFSLNVKKIKENEYFSTRPHNATQFLLSWNA